MALKYVPPVYMWIATYTDNQALPQFDPETGKENLWRSVDQSRLKSVGWFPISEFMAARILKGEGIVSRPRDLPVYEIFLKEGQKPYLRRTTRIPPGNFRKCLECGAQWIFSGGQPDPSIVKQGFPWCFKHKYVVTPGGPFRVAVCPGCGYHNLPTDKPEEKRIIRVATDMSYLVHKLGVEGGPFFIIDEWGEVMETVQG